MSDVPSRMLRETLRDSLKPPQETNSGCLDAETLAAWSDGTLARPDRANVETHAATCARCQAMLAAMAKTATPVRARSWWQTSTVRWLVPLATVSTIAVAVWVNVPSERRARPVAQLDVPTSSVPTTASAAETRSDDVAAPSKKSERKQPAGRPSQPKALDNLVAAPSAATEAAPSSVDKLERSNTQEVPVVDAQSPRAVKVQAAPPAPPAAQSPAVLAPAAARS